MRGKVPYTKRHAGQHIRERLLINYAKALKSDRPGTIARSVSNHGAVLALGIGSVPPMPAQDRIEAERALPAVREELRPTRLNNPLWAHRDRRRDPPLLRCWFSRRTQAAPETSLGQRGEPGLPGGCSDSRAGGRAEGWNSTHDRNSNHHSQAPDERSHGELPFLSDLRRNPGTTL